MKKILINSTTATIFILGLFFLLGFTNAIKEECVQFTSAATQSIYKDCATIITTSITPDKFELEGGEMISSARKNQVTIIPNVPAVTLKAIKNDQMVGKQTFKVIQPPSATISIKEPTGRPIDRKRGVIANSIKSLKIDARCDDENFKRNYPRDSRYIVQESEISLIRNGRPIKRLSFNTPNVNIEELGQQESNDRLLIEIKKVGRKNFKGQLVVSKSNRDIFNIPIN